MLALIILSVGIGVVLFNRNQTAGVTPAPGTTAPPGSAPASSAPPVTAKASDAVQAYLEALAAGQAETALALGDDVPADKTFLTDAVLADSNKRAPITAINVPEVDDKYAYSVDASYKLGSQAVTDKFSVKKVGDSWKVQNAYSELNLTYSRSKTLPMLVNQVAVKTDKIRIFPGSYAFTSGNKYIDYGPDNVLVLKSPTAYPSTSDIKPTLTDSGESAFVKAAKTTVNNCVKQKKLKPSGGCPFGIRRQSGQKVDESTIKWKLAEDPFDNLKPRIAYNNPAVVEATSTIVTTFSARGTQSGQTARFGPQRVYRFTTMSANMTKDPIKVSLTY